MLDTVSGSRAHPAVDHSSAARLYRTNGYLDADRRGMERRSHCRRIHDRRCASAPAVPSGFVERRKADRRVFDRRRSDRRAVGYQPTHQDRESLYADFQPLVRRLIRQYGDCPEVRQDLAGEIYFRFCSLLDAYEPARGVPLKPYLVKQLSASIYTYSRHRWNRQRREVSYDSASGMCDAAVRADPTLEWNDRLAAEQVTKTLPDAIAGLPRRQRQVVVWRYYEQRSFDEIARLLNVKTATARSLLRHGINSLRKNLRR